ncbi:MFS transporter [Mycobacterium gordonae]|uniref:Major facilitator superfamily (MFS) profile domain-containing protein n=2 Tax=Mycobacterium gordonae TaxID=1778 RepID=A0A1A6BE50_MYCGO|nr:MFS transporter [Mycobacterium gordonae]MBI2701654.1 MFS transporter [Mycobacterium sp.]MCV7006555.1 MFS transporter [Mycobacterium gordonae]OBS00595.1 hypothetical protein A9W98_24275 [Mycobacterium gordonae]ORV97841.1 hypothetical protein AWC08_11480 [Mycobacterium gordonae]
MTRAGLPVSRGLLAGMIMTGVVSVLDSTVVVPLLKSIGDEFGGGPQVAWLVSGYLLASTLTIPIWGRWLDLRGERDPMWAALGLFTLGTLLSCLATGFAGLVAGRVVQGMGAGGLVPLGEAIIAGRCTPSERARLQGQYNVAYGMAAACGPVIGGAVMGVSWRWAFALVLPFCAAAAWALRGQLLSRPAPVIDLPPFDYRGSAVLTVGLFSVLLAVERFSCWVMLTGVVLVGLFLRRTRTRTHTLIPAAVLVNRVVLGCTLAALAIGFVQYSYLTYLPELAHAAAHGMNSGLVAVPLTVMWMTVGSVSAVLALRVGTRAVVVAALVAGAAAGMLLLTSVSLPSLFGAAALVGAAASLGVLPALLLSQVSAGPPNLGATTSLLVLMRNFGGALGVSTTLAVNDDFGLTPSVGVLILVCAGGLLPVLWIPGPAAEAALRRAASKV